MSRIVPTHLRVEASSFCQLKCPSCPTTSGAIVHAVGSGFLRAEDFRALLDDAPSLTQVEISNYGEIFLNPEICEILRLADERGIAITIENGVNLNNVRDEALEALVKYRVRIVTCSIDGASQETYSRYRVRGNFDTVIANIRRINRYKQHYGSEYPALVWQFVVFGHNEHELPIARKLAEQLGMTFRIKHTWDDNFSPIRNRAFVRAQTGWEALTRAEHDALHGGKYMSGLCEQLWDDVQVNWDGRVLGCCRNFWGDFGGNVFDEGLDAAINNEKMVYARDMLSGRVEERADIPCTTCEVYRWRREHGAFVRRAPAQEAAE